MQGLPAREFRGWEMFDEIEPIGDIREDYRAASIAQTVYNANRGPKQKALPLKEFLLKFEPAEEKPRQTWQEQLAIMKMLAAAYSSEGSGVPTVTEGIGLAPQGAPQRTPPESPVVAVEMTEEERIKKYMAEHMAKKPDGE